MPSASFSVLIWVITFRHRFAMKSMTCTYIFWPSILHKWIYLIIIFTLEWYWWLASIGVRDKSNHGCHGYFLSLTQIKNGCHTVVGLTIIFKLNFVDSNMTPRFLGLNNFIISIVFMKFRVIFSTCSKTGIIAEASINGIQNIKSAVWVHLCLAWKMGQSKDIT